MAGTFDNVDLSKLPPPAALEVLSLAGIVDARLQTFSANWKVAQQTDPTLPDYDVATIEGDPSRMLQETGGYREGLVRERVNEAVLATFLAFAQKSDLVDRAAEYHTAPKPNETPASLRRRAQLAWENLSLGGSYGGYTYRALTVAPVEIGDVMVYGHEIPEVPKGEVHIVVMAAGANPAPSEALLQRIRDAFPRHGRKTNDRIVVRAARILNYTIDATLAIKTGADRAAVVADRRTAVDAYAKERRRIAALVSPKHVEGLLVTPSADLVADVALRAPTAVVGGGPFDVPNCTGLIVR